MSRSPLLYAMATAAWIGCGFVAAGGINASDRARFVDLYQSPYEARLGFTESLMFIPFGPLAALISAESTGGFYYGWSFRSDAMPCTSRHPDIWCK